MDWTIDPRNVESSFNRIAKELLTSYALYANAKEFRITEIEFYFYHPEHPDNYTHPHKRKKGEWRFHNQGLDITLSGNETQDGGILIRGIKNDRYVNGPRKIIYYLFQHFDNVESSNSLELKKSNCLSKKIIRTFRHLPNKITDPGFHDKYYRYLVDLDELQITNSEKNYIRNKSEVL